MNRDKINADHLKEAGTRKMHKVKLDWISWISYFNQYNWSNIINRFENNRHLAYNKPLALLL
ncbi:hypothetical protein OUZ56_030121 [Daphnia magna]|uniref:Uncharacterized protein n=1 Tax=Daphnia magna TaxID=35525 RepID=A0ABQ9ZQE5_9CRUS|nr:hypothetical protein OUZ56_030121 [Daphnia magna]